MARAPEATRSVQLRGRAPAPADRGAWKPSPTLLAPAAAQVIALAEYRGQLYDYLKSRMLAIAPNLTVLVGELVGARLIAHVGSLINLAKAPASTIQILGAEKALYRWARVAPLPLHPAPA